MLSTPAMSISHALGVIRIGTNQIDRVHADTGQLSNFSP
jgi:hypothetical protein